MSLLLIKGGSIVTMHAASSDLGRGDILIENDRIAAIAPSLTIPEGCDIIDAGGMIVMPGLINAHNHTWQTGLRGIAGDWTVPQYMRAMHRGLATHFRPQDIYLANLVGALNQINSGTTTLVDWCHNNPTPDHTDAAVDALEEAGIRAVFLHGSAKPDPKPGQRHFTEIPMSRSEVERLRNGRLAQDDALITMGLAILGPSYSIYDVTRHDVRLARERDLVASMHVGGGAPIVPDGFERLAQERLISSKINIVHGNNLSDQQIRTVTDLGAMFTVTAEVELQMGFGDPLTGRLIAFDSAVSVGTDIECAVRGDMFATIRTTLQAQRNLDNKAALLATGRVPDMVSINCRQALEWATINAARMVHLDRRLGALSPGKQADVILLRKDDLNIFPVTDPVGSIVMQTDGANVDTVLIAGRVMSGAASSFTHGLPSKWRRSRNRASASCATSACFSGNTSGFIEARLRRGPEGAQDAPRPDRHSPDTKPLYPLAPIR